ncbi:MULTISPECIES: arylsulfatase [unclassified Lentimonas]|uniref:sulfatase family protein n=1 Tax=unclassified Lentimonas TaxID=2630993 RepID=UPI001FD2307C|nr:MULTISPECIES: arylsulfatase [unclassified Lentimonas]
MNFKILSCLSLMASALFLNAETTPPNVVLIVAEDLGYGDLGCYGATKVSTPNIDDLAANGRMFVDAHSASAASSPSRYALLTGEYPIRALNGKGLWAPARNNSPLLIDVEQATIADLFKTMGYATAMIGNWQLGFGEGGNDWPKLLQFGPLQLGFDYFFGLPVGNSVSPFVYVENDQIVGYDPADPLVYVGPKASKQATPLTPISPEAGQRSDNVFSGAVQAHAIYKDDAVGTQLTEKAIDWMESQEAQPFFLYYSTVQIHHPYTPAPQFRGTSEAGLYGDVIHELDWIVGQIVKSLEAQDVLDNTLIILTSDNGAMFSNTGQEAFKLGHHSSGELLGYKFSAWEGGHRVPFIATWAGNIEPGTVSSQLISTVDLFATFAALTGQVVTDTDSINALPALLEEPTQALREHLVIAARQEQHLALRKGKWMYLPFQGGAGFKGKKPGQNGFAGPPAVTYTGRRNSDIQKGRIKKGAPPAQLYDLETDLGQTVNLYESHPGVVEAMEALLSEYHVNQ